MNKKIALPILIAVAAAVYISFKEDTPLPTQPPTQATKEVVSEPRPEALPPSEKTTAKEETQNLIPVTEEHQFPTIKRIEDYNILCFRAQENIFFLPREFAVLLTRQKKTQFVLPKQLVPCLKEGPLKIWVTEYDPVYNLPYRYYFEIKTTIKSIKPLESLPAPFAELNSQLFGTLYLQNSYQQVSLEGLEFHHFRFGHTALGPSLYADIEEVSSRQLTDADSFMKNQKFDSIFVNNYLAPSSQMLNIEKLIPQEFRDLYLDSDLVLTGENIALAHYYKFRKKIKIYVEPKKSNFRKVDQRFWMSFEDFKQKQKDLFILDLRSERQSSKLRLLGAKPFEFATRGANYPHAIVSAFDNPDLRDLINGQINAKLFDEAISILQSTPKTVVFYTTGKGDNLHRMLHLKLPMNLKQRAYGLAEGFHYLFIYSYFFGGFEFQSGDQKIELSDFNLLKNYLLLGY